MSVSTVLMTLVLLGANAFFVGAEFAAMSARRSQLEPLADQGNKGARIALDAMQRTGLLLATCQLGITVCSVLLGAISEAALHHALEPVVLAALNYGTRVATTASDAVRAAGDRPVYDFSLRRLDGPDAGPETARAAWIAGFAGTALPLAGLRHGIPTVGTMAHHAVMAHGEEGEEEGAHGGLRGGDRRTMARAPRGGKGRALDRAGGPL